MAPAPPRPGVGRERLPHPPSATAGCRPARPRCRPGRSGQVIADSRDVAIDKGHDGSSLMIRCSEASMSPHCSSSRRQDGLAVGRQSVEALLALVLLAPRAVQQALALQAPQERVERVLLDVHPLLPERLAQRIAVVLGPQAGQDGDDERATTQLQAQVLQGLLEGRRERLVAGGRGDAVVLHGRHTVCGTQYVGVKGCRAPRRAVSGA